MLTYFFFNGVALLLVLFVIWWFWIAKTTISISKEITIKVANGIYDPPRIKVTAAPFIVLNFLRTDTSPCSEYVVFDTLNVHEQLPLNKIHVIRLNNTPAGSYRFTCQMGMYQGELIVE